MWISQNVENTTEFFRTFYEYTKTVKPNVAPALVLLLGKYQYQDGFVANKEINVAAFVAEVMLEGIYD
jgi:galactokinase